MDRHTRLNKMIDILKASNGESFRALAGHFGVTEMTVRRDVHLLREQQLVKVVSGAVLYNGERGGLPADGYLLTAQTKLRTREKNSIGAVAASLVMPGDVVFIDIGTTTASLIRHLPAGIPIVAVCCTMNALNELQKKAIDKIISLGGSYVPDLQLFESPEGIELLLRTRVTKAFLSAAGVNDKLGVTCVNSCEVQTKCTAIASSLQKYLMVDSSKMGVVKSAFVAKLEDYDAVITDSGISEEWRGRILDRQLALYDENGRNAG